MNYKITNDYELLYLVHEKDDYSLELLLKKYDPILFKLSMKYYRKYKYIGIDLDDLKQEARIGFFKALDGFNDEESLFYSYVLLCVERQLINYGRTYNNLKNYPLNYSLCDSVMEDKNIYRLESVDTILLENEKYFECKNMLNFKQSVVFELKFNGFSYKEISILLDLPRSTVDGRVQLIRRKLYGNLNIKI